MISLPAGALTRNGPRAIFWATIGKAHRNSATGTILRWVMRVPSIAEPPSYLHRKWDGFLRRGGGHFHRMRAVKKLIVFLAVLSLPLPLFAWGEKGHLI